MTSVTWDSPFTSASCSEELDDNPFVIVTMILSNLALLLVSMYCQYLLGMLSISRDLRRVLQDKQITIIKTEESYIEPGFIWNYDNNKPLYQPIARVRPHIVSPDAVRVGKERYPSLDRYTIACILSWNGRDPSPQLLWNTIFVNLAMFVSIVYHSCQVADICPVGPFPVVHTLDRITANYLVSLIIMMFSERYSTKWIASSGIIYFLSTVLLEFLYPCNYVSTIFNIFVGVLFLILNIITLKEGKMDRSDRFYVPDIIMSFAFCTIGITLYMLDHYSYTHPPWHLLSALGILAAHTGTNRDIPFSPTFIESIKVVHYWTYDGVLLPNYLFNIRTLP